MTTSVLLLFFYTSTIQTYSIIAVRQAYNLEEVVFESPAIYQEDAFRGPYIQARGTLELLDSDRDRLAIKLFINSRIQTNYIKSWKLFYIQILKIIVPLLYSKIIDYCSTGKPAYQLLLTSEPILGHLWYNYITSSKGFKSSRNHIRLINKTSTALFRSNASLRQVFILNYATLYYHSNVTAAPE